MAYFPCPTKIDCPPGQGPLGEDLPYANLTSEDPDQQIYIGDPFVWGWLAPNLGSNWTRSSCRGVCTSTVSQYEADLCAALNELACLIDTWGTCTTCITDGNGSSGPPLIPRTNEEGIIFYNTFIQGNALCPDGTYFTYNILPGRYSAPSVGMANQIAQSFANLFAASDSICLSSLTRTFGCKDGDFLSFITASKPIVNWEVIAGILPPGTELLPQAIGIAQISGFPNTPGEFTFVVRATQAGGQFTQKSYTIRVMGFTTGAVLPNATKDSLYTQQLAVDGESGTTTYTHVGGTLPDGLTLSSSGLISGTPSTAGENTPVFRATDDQGNFCDATFSLEVEDSNCPDWTSLVWVAPTNYDKLGGANVVSLFASNMYSTFWNNVTPLNDFGVYGGSGTLNYTGGACNCQVKLVLVKNGEQGNAGFTILQDGLPRLTVLASGYATGTHFINFSILATAGSVITIEGTYGVNKFWTFGTGVSGPTSWGVAIYNV